MTIFASETAALSGRNPLTQATLTTVLPDLLLRHIKTRLTFNLLKISY